MKNIEIKLKHTDSGLTDIKSILDAIELRLNEPNDHYNTIEIDLKVSTDNDSELVQLINKNHEVSIRQGWSGGCYGARDGSQGVGLTLWFDALEVVSEYKSNEYGWLFNPAHLLKEHGTLIESIDGDDACDAFTQSCEDMGLSVKSDNTYNNENHFMFDFQFTIIESADQSGVCYMSVMFHCGGDPRGNYTSKQLYKFESHDELYSVLFPPEYEDESEAS